jgi:hypothetical protein
VQQLRQNENRLKQVLDDKLKALRTLVDKFLEEPDEASIEALQKVKTNLKHGAPTRQEFNQALEKYRRPSTIRLLNLETRSRVYNGKIVWTGTPPRVIRVLYL